MSVTYWYQTKPSAKLAVLVSAVDEEKQTKECIKWLVENTSPFTEIILIDNGSNPELSTDYGQDITIRVSENIGGNRVFHEFLEPENTSLLLGYKYVAFIHCDMMILEKNWDLRVIEQFEKDEKLGLLGFVGSNQLDAGGGRGLGTRLNFQGQHYPEFGTATPAEPHGVRDSGFYPAAVLDHCSMIFRVTALKTIPPQKGNFAPGHFYDRICCVEMYLKGWRVGYLGIACDHFSGGTGGGCKNRDDMYRKWLLEEGLTPGDANLDIQVYLESERRFLTKYRDELGFVPFTVSEDYSVTHPSWR